MDLVDEHHRARIALHLLDHLLQAFLEVAAIAGAGEQHAHVEREHRGVGQHFGHRAVDDAEREPLGQRGLADAGIADVERIVLRPAAQHLDRPLDFGVTADQGVDPALAGLVVQVDAIRGERLVGGLLAALGGGCGRSCGGRLLCAAHRARLGQIGVLRDSMGDVVDRVEAGHVLELEEIDGVALAFGEHRHQHVRAGNLLAAGRLHVNHRALHHPLEARGRLRVGGFLRDQGGQLGFHEGFDVGAEFVDIDAARAQHRDGVAVFRERVEQMFECRVFVPAGGRFGEGAVQAAFKVA